MRALARYGGLGCEQVGGNLSKKFKSDLSRCYCNHDDDDDGGDGFGDYDGYGDDV